MDVASRDLLVIKELLAKYKLDNLSQTGLRLSSSACVAFLSTCGRVPQARRTVGLFTRYHAGLAMAESERVRAFESCVAHDLDL